MDCGPALISSKTNMRKSLFKLHQFYDQSSTVSIGDDFTPEPVCEKDTKDKLNKYLAKNGHIPLNNKSRVMRLWQKCRDGTIKRIDAIRIRAHHKAEFAEFDRQAAMLERKAA